SRQCQPRWCCWALQTPRPVTGGAAAATAAAVRGVAVLGAVALGAAVTVVVVAATAGATRAAATAVARRGVPPTTAGAGTPGPPRRPATGPAPEERGCLFPGLACFAVSGYAVPNGTRVSRRSARRCC